MGLQAVVTTVRHAIATLRFVIPDLPAVNIGGGQMRSRDDELKKHEEG
jgi:hypothetical protein